MNYLALLAAAPLVLALAAPAAHAHSGASASLSFNVIASSGFTWLAAPTSSADSSASAAELTGFEFAAGVFSPTYGPTASAVDVTTGLGVPASTAAASADSAFGNAFSFGSPAAATLSASALVADGGRAEATSFARSYFSLDAGASVTFQGALLLSVTGSNLAFPANYSTGDFYSFASGLLAVGSDEALRELGGPASTGMVGSYSLNDLGTLSLTVTNTTGSLLTTYLDSGVTVYSASAVPEPGSLALLLAGLGAVATVVRRKSAAR
jgi:PEP-CTERM motif